MSRYEQPTHATDAVEAEKLAKICAMRRANFTWEQIGKALSVTKQAANKRYLRYLRETQAEIGMSLEDMKLQTLEQLDTILNRLWLKALPNDATQALDLDCLDRATRVIDQRTRLLGLDSPQKHQIDITVVSRVVGQVVDAIVAVLPDESIERVHDAVSAVIANLEHQSSDRAASTR
jgi:hypothetical protein